MEPPRVVVQMSTKNAIEKEVAKTRNRRTIARWIQHKKLLLMSPNHCALAFWIFTWTWKLQIEEKPFGHLIAEKKDPISSYIYRNSKLKSAGSLRRKSGRWNVCCLSFLLPVSYNALSDQRHTVPLALLYS